ncbi:MAG: MFS transporter [Burkholderiaceae bacterium]
MNEQGAAASDASGLRRGPITATVMLATIMQALDMTIANVALPHMQGTMSATLEQISWVLTSYVVAAAICMPLTGVLAARLGRRRLFMGSIILFTITSVMCGLAQNLEQIVLFRILQGHPAHFSCRCHRRSCSISIRPRVTAGRWRSGALASWWGRSAGRHWAVC